MQIDICMLYLFFCLCKDYSMLFLESISVRRTKVLVSSFIAILSINIQRTIKDHLTVALQYRL